MVLLAVISIVWSFEKANTLKDSVTIVGSSLFGFYFGSRYTLKQQLELLGSVFGAIVILSFIFAIALPKYGIMGGIHQGRWRGVFNHKNGLGQMMVYSSLMFMFLFYQVKKHKLLMAIGLGLSILLLLLSTSTSSMFNLFILICVLFMLRTLRFPYLLMIPSILVIVSIGELIYFWFIYNAEGVFSSFGKDTTLTGRTDLWPLVIEMIGKQPWIGYGYGGFWQGLNGAGSAYIWRATNWTPSHPHNGFLQILLDLGVLGLGIFTIGYGIAFVKSLAFLRSERTVAGTMGGVHLGAWRGIYNHKNVLGKIMVPSAIVFALLALNSRKYRSILWILFSSSIVLLILSKSSSPVVNLLISIGVFGVLNILRWNYFVMVPALIGISSIGAIVYSFLATNAEEIAGAFGKNLTLTGRTNFWPLVLDKIWEQPYFGYGFGAFWQGLAGPSAYVWNASTFKTPNGHNGYLDLCLELGFIGLGIYMLKFFLSFRSGLAYSRSVRTPEAFWPPLLLTYVVLSNLTESSLVVQNNFLWIMQLSTFFSLSLVDTSNK